jgi:hypothetical protein
MAPASKLLFGPSDTSTAVESAQLELYRRMSAGRKLELVEDADATARILALSGLAARHPEATESELYLRLFHLIHGRELATKAWGALPEEAPG